MRLEQLVGDRFKDRPSDCVTDSHAFMVRGGYLKQVANGIFSLYPPLVRICQKIENIIREEMDAIDGQEVKLPVVMPASMWEESGRYESIGKEMARLRDRNDNPLLLGMTHEEAAVQLVREYGQSHSRYPFMIYQIQTKFRDEARPRAGLIRAREFTMKDAYSFHTTQEDLEDYYQRCHEAYERIFARVGLPEVVSVASDSGMMGGSVSHEFMLLTPIGEDTIVLCNHCDFRANLEAAETIVPHVREEKSEDLTLVHTPNIHTIEDVCDFLGTDPKTSVKAVIYQMDSDDSYVVLFIRGDLEVNEAKLRRLLGGDFHPAVITENSGLHAGYIGPANLKGDFRVILDRSLEGLNNLSCGANQPEYHYTGLDMAREFPDAEYFDIAKTPAGAVCPECGRPGLRLERGIEVGNIFQLGTKYTQPMNMTYLDADGQAQYPVMGCYGIGIGRLAAAIAEAHHDEHGPIWPVSVAPWQVHLCAVRADDPEVRSLADELYDTLQKSGLEVIYDDRAVSAGIMFSDADLLGVPLRAVVSPRNLKKGVVELTTRDKSYAEEVPKDQAAQMIQQAVAKLQQAV